MTGGLEGKLRLDLTNVQKNDDLDKLDELPPIPTIESIAKEEHNQLSQTTINHPRQRPVPQRNSQTINNKRNLIINHSESSSDIDLDIDLEQIPVYAGEVREEKEESDHDVGPVIQGSQLPELEDDDDGEEGHEKDKLSLLYDLLLTHEQCEEPPDEWSYKTFIKEFAKSEAAEDNNDSDDVEEEYGDYEEEQFDG